MKLITKCREYYQYKRLKLHYGTRSTYGDYINKKTTAFYLTYKQKGAFVKKYK